MQHGVIIGLVHEAQSHKQEDTMEEVTLFYLLHVFIVPHMVSLLLGI